MACTHSSAADGVCVHMRSGIFDPFGFSKGNLKELQTKEIKNGGLADISSRCRMPAAQLRCCGTSASICKAVCPCCASNILVLTPKP